MLYHNATKRYTLQKKCSDSVHLSALGVLCAHYLTFFEKKLNENKAIFSIIIGSNSNYFKDWWNH